jgi:folate-binding protein YgfZ
LELRLRANGADVLVLAGDATAVARGFDQVIFPADRVRLQPIAEQRRVQPLSTSSAALWLDDDSPLPPNWTSNPANPKQFERWRIEQRLVFGPGELNADANPLELGLSDHVSLSKGCYLGQETVAKLANLGGAKQELRGWICNQVLSVGDTLRANGERAGTITSVLDTSEGSIGLALVRRRHLSAETLDGSDGETVQMNLLPADQGPAVG